MITLAWTRATVEDAEGRTIAIVERSTLDADRWHLHRMTAGNPPTFRPSAVETFQSWADLRAALADGVAGGLMAAIGATVTHDRLRLHPAHVAARIQHGDGVDERAPMSREELEATGWPGGRR